MLLTTIDKNIFVQSIHAKHSQAAASRLLCLLLMNRGIINHLIPPSPTRYSMIEMVIYDIVKKQKTAL